MKKGKFFGLGTGPGNPELMTEFSLSVIKDCEVIVLPNKNLEECAAYKIAQKKFPQITSKEILLCDFPMTSDKNILTAAWKLASEKICEKLSQGKNAAFLTIGDPCLYSTFSYVQNLVQQSGFEVEIVSGVPSFCAVAAKLKIPLCENDEELHILPGNFSLENLKNLSGTLVFMKSGKKLLELKKFLEQKKENFEFDFYAVSNCGLKNEKVAKNISELNENFSYFTIVILKNFKSKKNSSYKFFQNKNCPNFPCHQTDDIENFNCLFCYCPLYMLGSECGGNFHFTKNGVKSCKDCAFPHKKENFDKINSMFPKILEKMKNP